MNFLFISHFAGSRKHGMVLRTYNWAAELTRRGHTVTIAAASFSHYRPVQPASSGRVSEECIDGIRYLWFWIPRYDGKSIFGRLLSILVFTVQMFLPDRRLREEYDVIVSSSPQPFIIYPAYYLSKKNNACLIYDIRDLWPLTIQDLWNISRYNPLIWLMQKTEDFSCRRADLVTCVPGNAATYLESRGMKAQKFLPIGNSLTEIDPAHLSPLSESYRARLNSIRERASSILCYTGALGRANGIDIFLRSLKNCPSGIHALIVGFGYEKESLMALAHKLGLDSRVHFFDPIPLPQIQALLKEVDVCYISLIKKSVFQYGVSSTKMNDYMAAQKPVLYAVGDPYNPIEISGGGIVCEPGHIAGIAQAIRDLCAMEKSQRDTMGKKGAAWLLRNQTIAVQMDHLLAALTQNDKQSPDRPYPEPARRKLG